MNIESIPSHQCGVHSGGCFLKFEVPSDVRLDPVMVSGTIPGVSLPPRPTDPTPPPTCTIRDNWDFFGGDINDGCAADQRMESVGDCCDRCQRVNGCRAFTFVKMSSSWCPGTKKGESFRL